MDRIVDYLDVVHNPDHLIRLIDNWQSKRVLVAGDFMLDRYAYGNADRLSPDAPVPVLAVEHEESKPGGAANVCLDLLALRCEVESLGIIGEDFAGDQLRGALETSGCRTSGLLALAERPTTVKNNFVGLAQHRHPQKMFRVDVERNTPLPKKVCDTLLAKAEKLLKHVDVLCLEDYNKGVLTEELCQGLIRLAADADVPVLVDPAAITDYSKYRNATCLTPNRTEAQRATGMSAKADDTAGIEQIGRKLMTDLNLKTLVLTLDKQGALLLHDRDEAMWVPTVARSVYDVTGAGDMVLGMLAAAVANDIDWPSSVALANIAAGLEVEKFGVVPIDLDEILLSILKQKQQHMGKLRELDTLVRELNAYRKQGTRITFTNGCFDILHAGHVCFLRQAREHSDLLVIGLNSDDSIRRIKGNSRPVNQQEDRVMVLSELESVDYIVMFDEDTPLNLIQRIKPDALIKGADYTRSQVVGADVVESYGGQVILIDLVKGKSTTNIIQKVRNPVG